LLLLFIYFFIYLFTGRFPRTNLTQAELKEILEKNKSNKIPVNKNSSDKKKKKKYNNKNNAGLSERKNNNNIINQINIIKKMKPKKIKIDHSKKNNKQKIRENKSEPIINQESENQNNAYLYENNLKTKSKIEIDNNLIKKYVKKGRFHYNSKTLNKDDDISFEIFPESINENNLSPIKPVQKVIYNNNLTEEIKEINIIENKVYDNSNKKPKKEKFTNNNVKTNNNNNKKHVSKLKIPLSEQMENITIKCNDNKAGENDNNEKTLLNNSNIDDPFLFTFPKSNRILNDNIWNNSDYILCKEKKELSFTEEDDEILI